MDTIGDFKKRFEALGDIEELLSVAAPKYRSPDVYFQELIANEKDVKLAEKRLRVLEDLMVRSEEERLEKELERVVRYRDELLRDTDWTQLPDVPLNNLERKEYRKYREYLRDLPENIKSGTLGKECKNFYDWKKWVESVRSIPGYEKFIS